MMSLLSNALFWLGAATLLSVAFFAARTSYVDTPTVRPGRSDLLTRLFDEVERARRLDYPLTVARIVLRPGVSTAALDSATRSIDTVVGHNDDDVVHVLLPGSDDADAFLERVTTTSNSVATWSAATFPGDAMTIGELMLKVGTISTAAHDPRHSVSATNRTTAE